MNHSYARWLRILIILSLVFAGVLGAVRAVRAVEFDDDGTIGPDEVIDDDLFISWGVVTIDGRVNGDLFASGEEVTVNGVVDGNLIVSGSDVQINGTVAGSVVFAGQLLKVDGDVGGTIYGVGSSMILEPSASVARNLFFAGFSVEMEPESRLGRDLLMTGYQVVLNGRVDQDVEVDVAALDLRGSVGGDVKAQVSEPGDAPPFQFQWPGSPDMLPPGIRVAEGAEIGGVLTYASTVEQADEIQAVPEGGVVYERVEPEEARGPEASFGMRVGRWILDRARDLVTLLVLGGLIVWRAPKTLNQLADQVQARPIPATLWGAVVAIVGYVGIGLAALLILIVGILLGIVTLGGLARAIFGIGFSSLGLVFGLFTLAVSYGSKVVVAYLIGRAGTRALSSQGTERPGWSLVLGVLVYVLFRSIPILGWFIGLVVTFFGLGAMWLLFRERRPPSPSAPPEPSLEAPAAPPSPPLPAGEE